MQQKKKAPAAGVPVTTSFFCKSQRGLASSSTCEMLLCVAHYLTALLCRAVISGIVRWQCEKETKEITNIDA